MRYFSLIEVLIALGLVAIALPLLTLPYYYSMKNYAEINKSIEYEKMGQTAFTKLLIDLHLGNIPLNRIKEKDPFELPTESPFGKTTYEFKPLEVEETDKPQLFEVKIAFSGTPLPFTYQFILVPVK